MIVTNKLYRKDFNQYSEDDWKYIFSIYTLRDKYNFTEEEFLASELVGKVTMLKKMDENLFIKGIIDIDTLHKNELVFAPCPQDEGCKVIQDFLEDEDVKDSKDVQLIDKAIIEFLDKETDELEIIRNQFDIAFKDKSRLTIIRDYANQQLIDAQKDLDAVNATIENLNVAYLNLKTK